MGLNDEVVNFYTKFWQFMAGNGYNYEKGCRWTQRKQIDIFKDIDVMLFPICNGTHWSLGGADMVAGPLFYLCSFGSDNQQFDDVIRRYLSDEWDNKKRFSVSKKPNFSTWPIIMPKDLEGGTTIFVGGANGSNSTETEAEKRGAKSDLLQFQIGPTRVPRQRNSWDCGVFTILYCVALAQHFQERKSSPAEHHVSSVQRSAPASILEGISFRFGQDDIADYRWRMILEIRDRKLRSPSTVT